MLGWLVGFVILFFLLIKLDKLLAQIVRSKSGKPDSTENNFDDSDQALLNNNIDLAIYELTQLPLQLQVKGEAKTEQVERVQVHEEVKSTAEVGVDVDADTRANSIKLEKLDKGFQVSVRKITDQMRLQNGPDKLPSDVAKIVGEYSLYFLKTVSEVLADSKSTAILELTTGEPHKFIIPPYLCGCRQDANGNCTINASGPCAVSEDGKCKNRVLADSIINSGPWTIVGTNYYLAGELGVLKFDLLRWKWHDLIAPPRLFDGANVVNDTNYARFDLFIFTSDTEIKMANYGYSNVAWQFDTMQETWKRLPDLGFLPYSHEPLFIEYDQPSNKLSNGFNLVTTERTTNFLTNSHYNPDKFDKLLQSKQSDDCKWLHSDPRKNGKLKPHLKNYYFSRQNGLNELNSLYGLNSLDDLNSLEGGNYYYCLATTRNPQNYHLYRLSFVDVGKTFIGTIKQPTPNSLFEFDKFSDQLLAVDFFGKKVYALPFRQILTRTEPLNRAMCFTQNFEIN